MKRQKGFTLIELMIVVAIIGILAAIAVPKFVDLVGRAKDAATYGNLGALRSAITLYYAAKEKWPGQGAAKLDNNNEAGGIVPENIARIPVVKLGNPTDCTEDNLVLEVRGGQKWDPCGGDAGGGGGTGQGADGSSGWIYNEDTGEIAINCKNVEVKDKDKDKGEQYCQK